MLGLHLLHGLTWQLTHSVILGTDSQVVIKVLNNQLSHSGHYLLDAIHLAAERLHAKQDGIINCEERVQAINAGDQWKGDSRGVINLQIHWVPGHCDFAPNERADEEAKLAAQGSSSDSRFLPPLLRKKLPLSVSALRQENSVKLKKRWSRQWKSSERRTCYDQLTALPHPKSTYALFQTLTAVRPRSSFSSILDTSVSTNTCSAFARLSPQPALYARALP